MSKYIKFDKVSQKLSQKNFAIFYSFFFKKIVSAVIIGSDFFFTKKIHKKKIFFLKITNFVYRRNLKMHVFFMYLKSVFLKTFFCTFFCSEKKNLLFIKSTLNTYQLKKIILIF